MGGRMDIRGVYGFSSLMKQNTKAKNYAVFCFAGKKKLLFYIYDVIVKQNFYKRAANHYSHTNVHTYVHTMCMYIHTNAHLYVHVHSRGLNMEGEYVFGYGQYKYRGRLFFWLWIPPPDNGRNTKKQKSAHTPPKKNIILLFSSENGRHFVPLRRPKPRSVTSRRASRRS